LILDSLLRLRLRQVRAADGSVVGSEADSEAQHLDRVALLAIEQAHLLAADVGFFDERGAHLVRQNNAKQMNWRPFRA
jgi:hypothetical protein